MKRSSINITDTYMSILSTLSDDEKLDLIAKLSQSMRHKKAKTKKETMDMFKCFHEDWGGNGTPDEIAEELRKTRCSGHREIEAW